MRKYRLLPRSLGVAAIVCLMQGTVSSVALAGPMTGDSARGEHMAPRPADLEIAAVSAIAPAAAKPAPAPRTDREAVEPAERTRIVSYLILRGLQGAGPILGAR